jgi:glycerol-3-phosphate acyltransferase PlsY
MLASVVAFLAGYMVGAIPLGLVVSRAIYRVDIRRYGTGNIGASNIMHNIGMFPAAMVGLGIFLQGLIPPLAVYLLVGSRVAIGAAAIGAVIGYGWPVFTAFKNKGGRGVGVSTGAAAVISPLGMIPLLAIYGLGGLAKHMALGVLIGFVVYTGFVLYFAASTADRVAAVALLVFLITRRLEGVGEDLRKEPPLPTIANRLLFDHQPGQSLTGANDREE